MSNGVRELIILMPNDPAKAWQLQESVGSGRLEAYQSVSDIVLYGTDKQRLPVKGRTYLVKSDPKMIADKSAAVARIQYDGNWDPEPGGWQRLAAVMHNEAHVDLQVQAVTLGKNQLAQPMTKRPPPGAPPYKIAHLTGTGKFQLSLAESAELKRFVDGGGILLVDSAGGSSEFADSAEALLNTMFPGGLKSPLPADAPVFTAGVPKVPVRYRSFAKQVVGDLSTPRLKAIDSNGRNAVFYSREDLSGGLVGEPVDGIIGYSPESSTSHRLGNHHAGNQMTLADRHLSASRGS